MENNFWQNLKDKNRPFYALAPMAGITDSAFRRMCKKFGADVLYSEMASAAALNYDPKKTLELLKFSETERPYVVQLFGGEPKHFAKAAQIARHEIDPDGIDVNFGCPAAKVVKQGAGIALFKDLKRSKEALKYAIEGAGSLPVSIKARSRAGGTDILKFLDHISDLDIKAVMIHGRDPIQGFSGPIEAEIIKKSRNYFGGIIMANGGVKDRNSALEILEKTGADGLGIGQAALGRPWIFKAVKTGQEAARLPRAVFKEALEHCRLAYEDKKGRGMMEMRKHLCWYVQGLPGASELRQELVKIGSLKDVRKIFKDYVVPK